MLEFISQPWHWAVSGTLIALTMFLLLFFGKNFGVSGNLRTICAIGGGGKVAPFFNYNWRTQIWNLVFVIGAVLGGYIASTLLASPEPVQISESTITHLQQFGIQYPETIEQGTGFVPTEWFNFDFLYTFKGFLILVIGGFMVGFGARYAGGCTSGHAISGLSDLQLPSLIAVIGFFIGGLLMTHIILPLLF